MNLRLIDREKVSAYRSFLLAPCSAVQTISSTRSRGRRPPTAARCVLLTLAACVLATAFHVMRVHLQLHMTFDDGAAAHLPDDVGGVVRRSANDSSKSPKPPPPAPNERSERDEKSLVVKKLHRTAGKSANDTIYALVFPNAECAGEPFRVEYSSSENKCRHCRDLCSFTFPGDDRKANLVGGPKSVKVSGSMALQMYQHCIGTFEYEERRHRQTVVPEAGCVEIDDSSNHVKFVEHPHEEQLPVLVSGPVERPGQSYALLFSTNDCSGVPRCIHNNVGLCSVRFDSESVDSIVNTKAKSIAVFGDYNVDIHSSCDGDDQHPASSSTYFGSIRKNDTGPSGCTNLELAERVGTLRFVKRELHSSVDLGEKSTSYVIAYSTESSKYFAWQSRALFHSYRQTQTGSRSRLIRLLSSAEPDDLMNEFPTVQMPQHPYSVKYHPYNKPDSLNKWLHSPHGTAAADVVVVIDPDNWLLRDLSPWVEKVERGRPIAQAAWYVGSKLVDELWSIVCERNCKRNTTDHAAVPLFIHREDLKEIAPLWSHYTMKVRWYNLSDKLDKKFAEHHLVGWCDEMLGYVYAAAHAGVHHRIERYLQLRDTDPAPTNAEEVYAAVPMIHMGRAFFPLSYGEGAKFHHTEGEKFAKDMGRGRQVWCKCNHTAWDVVPWPLPPSPNMTIDFVSNHTLRILHEAKELNPTFPSSK